MDPSIECSSFYLPAVDSFGNIYQLLQAVDSSYQQPTACIRKAVKEKPQRISGHLILFIGPAYSAYAEYAEYAEYAKYAEHI